MYECSPSYGCEQRRDRSCPVMTGPENAELHCMQASIYLYSNPHARLCMSMHLNARTCTHARPHIHPLPPPPPSHPHPHPHTPNTLTLPSLPFSQTPFAPKRHIRTVSEGAAVQGAGGGPALADAVEGAVADVPAHGAHPRLAWGHGFIQVLPVPHEQAVPAEHPLQTHTAL